MALPTLKSLQYEMKLSSGEAIEYRPYLIKEERQLLVALESGDERVVGRAVRDIIDACTFNKVNVGKLPIYDVENIFINMRAKSVGEKIKVNIKCAECEHLHPTSINLDEIEVHTPEIRPKSKVMINETTGMVLRAPTYDMALANTSSNKSPVENLYDTLISCVDKIFDEENVYECDKESHDEVVGFVESLPYDKFNEIKSFLDDLPSVRHDVDFACTECGHKNHHTMSGLADFFT